MPCVFWFCFWVFFFCCMLLPLVIFANNYYQVFPDPQLVKKYHKETISIGTSNLTLKCEGKLSFSREFSCVVLLTKVKPGTASPDIPNTFSGGVLHLKNARRDLGMDFGYGHLMKYSKYALWEKLFCSLHKVFLCKGIFVSPWWEYFCGSTSSFPLRELILTKILLEWHKVRHRNQKDAWLLWITVTLKNNVDPCCVCIWTQRHQNFTVHCLDKRFTIHSLLISSVDILFYREDKVIRQKQKKNKNLYFIKLMVIWDLNLGFSGSASQGTLQFLTGSATVLCCTTAEFSRSFPGWNQGS